ncbi:MAG: TetR/AcrR family transcriptional regulator [Prevotellaceae bacterium]|nr:TetR/AcrR family transcriptional regulator [Prevotellaceae bacterium]
MEKTGTPNEYRRVVKERILEYAMREFLSHGIRAVTMNDIATELCISKRTVYEIYADKQDLVLDCLHYHFQMAKIRMQEETAKCSNVMELLVSFYNSHINDISNFCPAFTDDLKRYAKAMEYIQEITEERNKKALMFFERGVEEGYFRSDVDYDVVLQLTHETTIAFSEKRLFERYSLPMLFRNFLLTYLRGISTLKGVELLDGLLGNQEKIED